MIFKMLAIGAAFAVLAVVLAIFAIFPRPTRDPSALKAIEAESRILMVTYPTKDHAAVPKRQWPRVIASLDPYDVTVYPDGVDIWKKPYFDGGWGYFIPRNARELPEPVDRFSEVGQGVYWYEPY